MKRTLILLLLPLMLAGLLLGCRVPEVSPKTTEEIKSEEELSQKSQESFLKLVEKDEVALDLHGKMLTLEQAIADGDFNAAYALVQETQSEARFRPIYNKLSYFIQRGGKLAITGYGKSFSDGRSSVRVTYRITAGEERYEVELSASTRDDGTAELTGLRAEELPTLAELEMKTHKQTFHLVVFILFLAMMAGALVDCIRQRVKIKWLWILLIVFASLQLSLIAEAGQFKVSFSISLLMMPGETLRNAVGESTTNLNLPIGAITYLIFRKRLL